MNKSIQIISFLLFLIISNVNAQKFELGKVSIEELNEKSHPKDTSAVAAVLFDKGEVQFEYSQTDGFTVHTTVKKRIKIYKKEGYDWANKSVEYYLGGNGLNETVSFSDVVSYNLVAGKIEKTKIKSDGIFDEKINRYWGRKKITIPNVKVGSIIEYEYTIKSPRISELKEWAFQNSIPVNYSEFKTYIPEYFIYNPYQKGYVFPKVSVEKEKKTITIKTKERDLIRVSGGTTFSNDNIDYTQNKTTYLAENMPAMKQESYVNNIDNYTSSISHELSMTKYPNSVPKAYSTSWETVVKTIYDYDDFGPELNKTGYFEEDIKTLIANLNTQDEKIAAIFQYVKSRVKWDNYLGYSCNDGVKTAYKNKTGNVAEINLMLTAMLRYAGIEANPILVSTRSNGIAFFPSRTAFNYVIAGVEVSNNLILLDATDKFSVPNVLPLRDLNWFGRLIRKDGTSSEVDLMPKTVSRESSNLSFSLNSDGTVSGKIKNQFSNNNALDFRTKNSGTVQETYLENLENKNNNMEITEYVRENENDLSNLCPHVCR